MKNFPLFLAVAFLLACRPAHFRDASKRSVPFQTTILGEITDQRISEISGMTLSRRHQNMLWVINDSGDDANLYAVTRSGTVAAVVTINNADNVDWEDLASFTFADQDYLLIADVGNNVVHRDVFSLYILPEPALEQSNVDLLRRIDFQYSDGARDCEAVAVDAVQQKILLLSKRDVPAVLYEIAMQDTTPVSFARRLGVVTSIPQPTPDEMKRHLDKYHAQPTAMDFMPDYSMLSVLTYRRLFLYPYRAGMPIINSLNAQVALIEFPALEQAEAVCFDADNRSILITTEKLPALILKITPSE